MRHRGNAAPRPRALTPVALLLGVLGLWALAAGVVAVAMPAPAPETATTEAEAALFELADNPDRQAADVPQAERQAASKRLADVLSGGTVLREGDEGLPVKFVQQRLNMAGIATAEDSRYDAAMAAAVTRLQEKHDLTQTGRINRYTLNTLLEITERGPSLPAGCLTGTVICVDQTQKVVRLVSDGNATITLDARFGSFGTATDEGAFTVYDKRANDWSQEFGVPMQYSLYFSGGQAIHYSDYFAQEGYAGASRGCVNTRDLAGTAEMFNKVPRGTAVYVYS